MFGSKQPGAAADPDWQERLAFAVETMRDISRQTDAEQMVWVYSSRIRQVMPTDGLVTLSRRGLAAPHYHITRSSRWSEKINPWKQQSRLPLLDRGLLGELLYGDVPVIIDELRVPADDPAAEYLEGHGSLMAIPLYDGGTALNMVVVLRRQPAAFSREELPQHVWMSNLFGQITQNLVLSDNLRAAYDAVDRELQAVAAIQRSLLPATLPDIPHLELATHYQTSRRAGGDYYDFFELPDGKWGILIADVSGHGTPAAVLMAITHSVARLVCDPPCPPGRLLAQVNDRLARLYTLGGGQFVTAVYAVYDPATRTITYASAGHPPPRLRRADGRIEPLDAARSIPLGIVAGEAYGEARVCLLPGDTLVFYTDGITEARDPSGELFDLPRLDAVLSPRDDRPADVVRHLLEAVEAFTRGRPAGDDRTLLVVRANP